MTSVCMESTLDVYRNDFDLNRNGFVLKQSDTIVRHRTDPWMPSYYLPNEWPTHAKMNNIKMLASSSNKVESGCLLQCCSKVSYMYHLSSCF